MAENMEEFASITIFIEIFIIEAEKLSHLLVVQSCKKFLSPERGKWHQVITALHRNTVGKYLLLIFLDSSSKSSVIEIGILVMYRQ